MQPVCIFARLLTPPRTCTFQVLFLDSLDQLEDTTFGRRLEWLPVADLHPHVRVVLSTLPDDGESIQILSWLRRRMQSVPDNMVEAKPIKRESGLNVLTHILRKRGRGVTEEQQSAIMDAFDKVRTRVPIRAVALRHPCFRIRLIMFPCCVSAGWHAAVVDHRRTVGIVVALVYRVARDQDDCHWLDLSAL